MPPKKNVDVEEKAPRKRKMKEKVEKPKLKTPLVIRVKMPKSIPKSIDNTKENEVTSLARELAQKRKIELANEVAQAQLGKPKLELLEVIADTVKKRGPKKQTVSTKAKPSQIITKKTATKAPKLIRKTPPKAAPTVKKTEIETPAAVNKRKADSTSNQPTKRPQRRSGRKKIIIDDNKLPEDESVPEKKPTIKRKGKNAVADTADQLSSPHIDEAKNIQRIEPEKEIKKDTNPALINSRATSPSECPSWAKDISSSSTTTCITIDPSHFKKRPVIMLSNIDSEMKKMKQIVCDESESSDSDSSSSSSSSSSCSSSHATSNSLNLSRSSRSEIKFQPDVTQTQSKREEILAKLAQQLQQIDIKAINHVGHNDLNIIPDTKLFNNKVFKRLKYENEALKCCREIQNILKTVLDHGDGCDERENQRETAKSPNESDRSDDDDVASCRSKYVPIEQNLTENDSKQTLIEPKKGSDDEVASNNVAYTSFDKPYDVDDDDDALSIFAESLTGLESTKSSPNSIRGNPSYFDEYVPQPASANLKSSKTYIPTKIAELPNAKANYYSEMQNADSTRGSADRNRSPQPLQMVKHSTSQTLVHNNPPSSSATPKTLLIHRFQKPLVGIKSVVFRGVCFFNLISNCKKGRCNFPHVQLDNMEITNRLTKLDENLFIQEYMLLRNWPDMRRKYGLLYVHECVNRKLTEVLVEMSIDFIERAKQGSYEDATLKIHVIEKTLLYLNNTDLKTCEDLLKYPLHKDGLLCDTLMNAIATTQNFSRFKVVFVKLVNFMVRIGRKIPLEDANSILERVCILPYEEHLASAVLMIIGSTNAAIFDNSMMPQFEGQLKTFNPVLYNDLCSLRERVSQDRGSKAKSPEKLTSNRVVQNNMVNTKVDMFTRPFKEAPRAENSMELEEENTPTKITQKVIRPRIFNRQYTLNSTPRINTNSSPYTIPSSKRPWPRSSRGGVNMGTPSFAQPRLVGTPNSNRGQRVVYGARGFRFPRRLGQDFY